MDVVRERLTKLINDNGTEMAFLSQEVCGRNHSYIQQFLKRGSPRLLPEDCRVNLETHFEAEDGFLLSPELAGKIKKRTTNDVDEFEQKLSSMLQEFSEENKRELIEFADKLMQVQEAKNKFKK